MNRIGGRRLKMKTKPLLDESYMKKRMDYAVAHAGSNYNWFKWISSDEKKFNLDGPDGFNYVWVFDGNKAPNFSKTPNARASVMVWGGIFHNGKTPLMEVNKKSKSKDYIVLLEAGLLPVYEEQMFKHDGAKIHTSKETREWMEETGVIYESWPPRSPDMNPIENAWSWLARAVYSEKPVYKNVKELKKAIFKAWDEMPISFINSLIESMPSRMIKVIQKNGGAIDY